MVERPCCASIFIFLLPVLNGPNVEIAPTQPGLEEPSPSCIRAKLAAEGSGDLRLPSGTLKVSYAGAWSDRWRQ
jgi:hypothetical protein